MTSLSPHKTSKNFKVLILEINEYKNDKNEHNNLTKELDRYEILKENISINITANNNLMIYLKNKHDAIKIANDSTIFAGKKKMMLYEPEQIDIIIKGMSFEAGDQLMDDLKSLGIVELINLNKKKETNKEELKSNNKKELNIVGARCLSNEIKNKLINEGIKLDYHKYKVEEYIRPTHIIQCHNCNGFNHKIDKCTSVIKCLKCSGNHSIKECTSYAKKCSNCGENHHASYRQCKEFQKKIQEKEERLKLKAKSPSTRIESANPIPISPPRHRINDNNMNGLNINNQILLELRDMKAQSLAQNSKLDDHLKAIQTRFELNENEIINMKKRTDKLENESNECWNTIIKHEEHLETIEIKQKNFEEETKQNINILQENLSKIQKAMLRKISEATTGDIRENQNSNNIKTSKANDTSTVINTKLRKQTNKTSSINNPQCIQNND